MASLGFKGVLAAAAACSLMVGSTAAMAAPAPVQQVDPWAVLTAMSSGAPAAAMCGSAAAAATSQGPGGCVLPVMDAPPPPPAQAEVVPPPPPPAAGINPLFIALLAIAAGVGIFLAVNNGGTANSPA